MQLAFATSRVQLAYETGCRWTLRLGTLRLETVAERLLPREVAPMFERSTSTCSFPCEGRVTSWFIVMFRRRLIVDFIRSAR